MYLFSWLCWVRDQIRVSCIGSWILYHRATGWSSFSRFSVYICMRIMLWMIFKNYLVRDGWRISEKSGLYLSTGDQKPGLWENLGRSRDVVTGSMEFLDSQANKNITRLSTEWGVSLWRPHCFFFSYIYYVFIWLTSSTLDLWSSLQHAESFIVACELLVVACGI